VYTRRASSSQRCSRGRRRETGSTLRSSGALTSRASSSSTGAAFLRHGCWQKRRRRGSGWLAAGEEERGTRRTPPMGSSEEEDLFVPPLRSLAPEGAFSYHFIRIRGKNRAPREMADERMRVAVSLARRKAEGRREKNLLSASEDAAGETCGGRFPLLSRLHQRRSRNRKSIRAFLFSPRAKGSFGH